VAFAANALSPAKINHVSIIDIEQKHLEVIVDDSQLSLAIGKKGQNVRLAAKLLGWQIDIKSEEEKRQEIESQMAAMALRGAPIANLEGLGGKTLERLRNANIETVEELAQMTPEELMQIQGIGDKTIDRIRRVVTDYFEKGREAIEQAALEQEAEALEEAAAVPEAEGAVPESDEPVPEGEEQAAETDELTDEMVESVEAEDSVEPIEEPGEAVEAEDSGEPVEAEAVEESEVDAGAESAEEEIAATDETSEVEKPEESTEEKG
jgi:N utilization substance protein A